ncbi:MAG TPA: SdiA-regulated family protein [Puia sp.]
MSESLREISGLVTLRGNGDTLYAIEDEEGKLFYFHPGDGKFPYKKFGKRGDYEDVTILDNKEFVVLRSDGSLFVFPLSLVSDGNTDPVEKYENILPAGEYEGLFGDDNGKLIALCKNCPDDDQRSEVSGYVLERSKKGPLTITDHFKVNVSQVKLTSIKRKVKFHPSCIARHPLTRDWYIISSVNKILLILDDHWKVKAGYPLAPSLFKQPEGLAFDKKGNMYISNEGGDGNANVLLFKYN